MKTKTLTVKLPPPSALVWSVSFAEVTAARVKHYAEKNEFEPDSPEYARLVKISEQEAEIFDWARRVMAPEEIRKAWFKGARISVKTSEAGEVSVGLISEHTDPVKASLELRNAELLAELAKLKKTPATEPVVAATV